MVVTLWRIFTCVRKWHQGKMYFGPQHLDSPPAVYIPTRMAQMMKPPFAPG